MFTAETQRTLRKDKHLVFGFLCVLCASAVKKELAY
jgi:hypothetical protein